MTHQSKTQAESAIYPIPVPPPIDGYSYIGGAQRFHGEINDKPVIFVVVTNRQYDLLPPACREGYTPDEAGTGYMKVIEG